MADGITTFDVIFVSLGRCYYPVADGMATLFIYLIVVMADVIAQWQME